MIIRQAEYYDLNNIRSLVRLCGIGDDIAADWRNYVLALAPAADHGAPIMVGCAGLDYICKEAAVLVNVATHIAFRKQGVASKLIELIVDLARANGVRQIGLCTMYYSFKFFQHRGWVNYKRQNLPAIFANYHQFTEQRYKKCGCMIRELAHGNSLDTVSTE